jgi:hypothetical protein
MDAFIYIQGFLPVGLDEIEDTLDSTLILSFIVIVTHKKYGKFGI